MCGIYLSIARGDPQQPNARTRELLSNRGPDCAETIVEVCPRAPDLQLYFLSTVLSLRGSEVVQQPIRAEPTSSILCWNGEAWKIGMARIEGNDSQAVFDLFLGACSITDHDGDVSALGRMVDAIASISGPFAFAFYDAPHARLFFGRDCLGRRSLLKKINSEELTISSVCDNESGEDWIEVDADGIYVVDLSAFPQVRHIPQVRQDDTDSATSLCMPLPFPAMNKACPEPAESALTLVSPCIDQLHQALLASLELRTRHVRDAKTRGEPISTAKVAVLFSGGLDCSVLARLCHDVLPLDESIDLLNVAFYNPRIHGKLDESDTAAYDSCPDRATGRSSFAELQRVCPGRTWRFVEVNVPYSQTLEHRSNVISLMHPHNTEMDLSISYAFYFASKGAGIVRSNPLDGKSTYTTTAHVLLSGLGADELFGGYQRHELAFSRKGYAGLVDELELDFDRLGKRNLGRDDRVISDSGREVRFPFLDEDLIAWALACPVWGKCSFGQDAVADHTNTAASLEPGKKILRLLAWRLGLKNVAAEKKRAIQFGSRTAKMVTGKTKGTQVLT